MTLFIAEIGSNHNRDLNRTLQLIDKAREIGCWAVKFQLFKASNLYHPSFVKQIEKMKQWELPEYFLESIKERCVKNDLKFICTPFDLDCIEILEYIGVDFLKIGSYELYYMDLINAVIDTKIPWMISAGMLEYPGNLIAIHSIAQSKNPIVVIFHCCSNYPAKPENCNLQSIKQMIKIFGVTKTPIGWSDHTRNAGLVLAAIGQGASVIEFHFDLDDQKGFESEFGHCWTVSEAKRLINRAGFLESIGNLIIPPDSWLYSDPQEQEASKWRTDPEDGLRPLKKYRAELLKNQKGE